MQEQEKELTPAPRKPFELEIENLELIVPEGANIASGWTPWSAQDSRFEEPEFVAVELKGRPRVQGIRAESRYDACLWQQAKTIPGFAVTFTTDFNITPGKEIDEARPEGMVIGVGIDPFGGTDPRSDSVQWGLRDLEYSRVVTASVTAIAQSDVVTAFVRSIAFIPGSTTAAGNATASVCRHICARIMYARTYLLLYPGASQALWGTAGRVAHQHNWTLGGGADDAGLGEDLLLKRTVIAVEPGKWPEDLEQWFRDHYPPEENFEFVAVSENELPNL